VPTLDWIGKKAVLNHDKDVPFHLLQCDKALSVGDPGSGNLLVEGDNLLALKALLPYYAGQVKCIYIDPPYNTGNEGWVYNDAVNSPEMREWLGQVVGKEADDLSRHDKWLCMMYPRIKLLREFLREDGAIFVSIDDNEVAHLRMLLEEVFGARNFIANVIWEKNYAPKASSRHFSEMHDHVLVFARSEGKWSPNPLPRTDKQNNAYKNPDNDPRGLWRPNNLAARNFYSKGTYSITCPSGRVISGPPKGSYWRVSEENFKLLDNDGRIWWGKNGNNVPAPKIFLSEVKDGVVPMTIWPYREVGHTQEAKKELVAICEFDDSEAVFITPKPTALLERVIQLASNEGDLILDSFAGSGTTGHAILKANKANHDHRKFILIEMDTTICRGVTAQRVRRAVEGYAKDGMSVEPLGGGFRYCRLGKPLFDEDGNIRDEVTFAELAAHVYFCETGEPIPKRAAGKTPLLGVHNGRAVYLLYNGVLGDKSVNGGNVLTRLVLESLPPHGGPKVVYGTGCRLGRERLRREQVTFRQTPYEIRIA
jgi:adenine-specific DNA-methyltransferase